MKTTTKFLYVFSFLAFTACSNVNTTNILSKFSSEPPVAIKEAVTTRINPENELYALTSANLSKSGSIVAQSIANKEATSLLKSQIKKEVENIYKNHLTEMDPFSRSMLIPVTNDLSNYATDLIMKKITQKGAWEDNSKIYSLLSVNKSEIHSISGKILKNFIENAAKKLDDISNSLN